MNRLTARNTSQLALALAGALTTSTVAIGTASAAPQLVYYQDFQEQRAFGNLIADNPDWISSATCNTYARSEVTPPPISGSITPDAPECTGRVASETILWSGGRLSARKSIPAGANQRFCVTSWVRAKGTAKPFLGVNFVPAAATTGFADQGPIGGCRNGEHYLISPGFDDNANRSVATNCGDGANCCYINAGLTRSNVGYGATTVIEAGNAWGFYSKTFTVGANDVAGGNSNMVLKLQNFDGAGTCVAGNAGAANAAEFDDIRVYRLPDAADVCPTEADARAAGDDTHVPCAGATAFCTSENVNVQVGAEPAPRVVPQTKCVGCNTAFGDAGDFVCGAATPACDNGTCKACNGDNDTDANAACGTAEPYCKLGGTCGKCVQDTDCNNAAGIERAGVSCNVATGQCTSNCTVTADGGSDVCGTNGFCPGGAEALCQNKLPNGAQIPIRTEEPMAMQGKCLLEGARVTATIFCASGTCDVADDKCGLADDSPCNQVNGSTACRAGVCGADGKCGIGEGLACDPDAAINPCRGSTCIEGFCGGPPKECVTDAECGSVNFVCNAQNKCQPGCRAGVACPTGKVCDSTTDAIGACVDAPSTSSSSGGSSSSSGGSSSSSGEPTTSSSSSSSGSSSGGETPIDGGEEEGGGCSTSTTGGNAASFTPMLIGLGVMFGAMRRRRVNARG